VRGLRVALLLLAVTLAVPAILLVARAREGERRERDLRHEAIAARVFDEMERRLTTVLEEEESRPFEAYRVLVGEETGDPGPAPPRFVIGHFQLDPDGRFHARPGADIEPVVLATLARDLAAGRGSARAGTSLPVADAEPELVTAAERAPREGDAYEVLSRLNLARAQRAERKQQVLQEARAKLYGEAAVESFAAAGTEPGDPGKPGLEGMDRGEQRSLRGGSSVAVPQASSGRPGLVAVTEEAERELASLSEQAELPSGSAVEKAGFGPDDARAGGGAGGKAAERVRVVLDPMLGRPVAGGRLLLYRTVLVDERGYRQGALLDRVALEAWLEQEVLEPEILSGVARLRFDAPQGGRPWAPAGHRVFAHRFAEPFDALSAQLALAPLPSRSGSSALPIYALAGLLVLVGAGGLFAVDRMTRVVVSFAERRSRFVASVSHELKTPLTAIRMYAEMLRDGLVGDEAKRSEYYRTITDESERLSRLIDNVLEFSRLEKGRREIQLAVGALPEVLEEAADKLRPHAERQGFHLRVEVQPGLPAVRFDRDVMLQVIFNLVDNAIKYSQPASLAEVLLEAGREGDRVVLGVRDYGPGVDRRHLAHIFEPFYRAEEELTHSTKGSGIGLALVKELGQAMGAAVSGANAPGGGFRVSLSFEPAGV
jgi:two-component system sensor histidine kinase VicK